MRNRRVLGFAFECVATQYGHGGVGIGRQRWGALGVLRGRPFAELGRRNSRPFHASSSLPRWTPKPPQQPSTHPSSSVDTTLAEQLRAVMRLLTNTVVVCTSKAARTASGTGTDPIPPGLTMSSFTSLSLAPPRPVVSFNIAVPSRTAAAVAGCRAFMVHVLSGDAAGAKVADLFATGNVDTERAGLALEAAGCEVVCPPRRPTLEVLREGLKSESEGADEALPYLRGPGISFVLRCRLLDQPSQGMVPVRDHVIVLGEVLEIIEGELSEGNKQFGLVYADRHYRQLGDTVVNVEPGAG